MALTGRAIWLATAGIVVVFVVPLGGWMVAAVAGGLLVAVVVDVVLAASPRAVALSRAGPASTRLGEPVDVRLVLDNRGRRELRGLVRDAWPPSAGATPRAHRVALPAGRRVAVQTTLTPTRRGQRNAAAVTLRAVGPLGVAARQRSRQVPGEVQVLPAFASRRFLPEKLARLRQLDGAVVAPIRGQGSEFDSLRHYVVGDDPRSIDWRATARRSDVVVRTWRPERDRQLMLVLDTGRTAAARVGDAPRLDAAIDAALLLTALARHAGDRVSLLAHDSRLRTSAELSRGGDALAGAVRAVTPVEPALVETDMRGLVGQLLRRLRHRSLIVLFTALEPTAAEEGLLPAIGPLLQRHVVVVAAVTDPQVAELRRDRDAIDGVYAAAAAESALAGHRRIATSLRRRGVVISEAPPETFASHVADTYLDLKAAGRL